MPESTPAALIVIPPATVAGSMVNVGAGEPVMPVKAKPYGRADRAAAGVPVKSGGTSVLDRRDLERELLDRVRGHAVRSRSP